MSVFKCKMCGGDIELSSDKTYGTCENCGSVVTFPEISGEAKAEAAHIRKPEKVKKAKALTKIAIGASAAVLALILILLITAIVPASKRNKAATETSDITVTSVFNRQTADDYEYREYGFMPEYIDISELDDSNYEMALINRDYIIPDGYVPKLEYAVEGDTNSKQLDYRVAPHYNEMYQAAAKDGIYLTTVSGYRSYELQKTNFESKIGEYVNQGYDRAAAVREAAKTILPPGTSEHNAGIAMDIISLEQSFENTKEFKWLTEHAQDYGFILRYPKDKVDVTEIIYEPWHWRYVGVENAKKIKASGLCLEEYLGITPAEEETTEITTTQAAVYAGAQENSYCYVNTESSALNVRSRPGMDSNVLFTLEKNTVVYCKSVKDGWAEIQSGADRIGYAKSEYLEKCPDNVNEFYNQNSYYLSYDASYDPGSRERKKAESMIADYFAQYNEYQKKRGYSDDRLNVKDCFYFQSDINDGIKRYNFLLKTSDGDYAIYLVRGNILYAGDLGSECFPVFANGKLTEDPSNYENRSKELVYSSHPQTKGHDLRVEYYEDGIFVFDDNDETAYRVSYDFSEVKETEWFCN